MHAPSLRTLRNRRASTAMFRKAARTLAPSFLKDVKAMLKKRKVKEDSVMLVFILRSAVAFLDAAVAAFPSAPVAFAGLRRDEKTAVAHWYYENIPPVSSKTTLVIIDPMLATGGSAEAVVHRLMEFGADARNIYVAALIGAPEGVARISVTVPAVNIHLGALDKKLDARKFIIPGLGDFGDRFFGMAQ